MAIVAGVVLTQFGSASHDQLLGAARIVAADVAHARNLAVTNNSSYTITFDPENNRYTLWHSGTNDELDVLPSSAFHSGFGATTQHVTDLASLPLGPSSVKLAVVEASEAQQVGDIEFGPLGETLRTSRTTIWLSTGVGSERRFIAIDIDPITGLASVGDLQTSVPESLASTLASLETDPADTEPPAP